MRRVIFFLLFLLTLSFVIFPRSAYAKFVSSEQPLTIDERVDDDLFVVGPTVNIESEVIGDLYVAGGTVRVRGTISGDIIAVGGTIKLEEVQTGEDVRLLGGDIQISNSEIGDSLTAFSGNVRVDDETNILGGVIFAAGQVNIDGTVQRGVVGAGGNLLLGADVTKDVTVGVDNLKLEDGARIGGVLNYAEETEAEISPQATVSGQISKRLPADFRRHFEGMGGRVGRITERAQRGFRVFSFLSALFVGLLIIRVFPSETQEVTANILKKPLRSLLWGLLGFALVPIVFMILVITVLGAPLALALIFLVIIETYLAKIFMALFLGQALFELGDWKKPGIYWVFVLGLAAFYVLRAIPVVGFVLSLATLFLGFGALLLYQYKLLSPRVSK